MKIIKFTVIVIVLFFYVNAQDKKDELKIIYPAGLFIEYGSGYFSIKDEYISDQKYSGNIPYFSLGWSHFKEDRGYLLGIESRNSSEIYNYHVGCKLTQNMIKQDFFYSIGRFSLFKNDVHVYMGPSLNILLYSLRYDFGTYNHVITESNGTIVSLGLNTHFYYRISEKLFTEESIHLSLASVCAKAFQSDRHDEPESKFLFFPKAMNTDFNIGIRYYIFNFLSARVIYKFQAYQIDEWDPMISSSNSLIFSFTCHFNKQGKK